MMEISDKIVSSDELRNIDMQHKRLGELARAACHTLKNENSPTEFRETLNRLLDFTVVHFTEEERLMGRYCYEGKNTHQLTHSLLLNRLMELEKETFVFDKPSKARLLNFIRQDFWYHTIEDQHAWMAMSNMRKNCRTASSPND